VHTDGQRHGDNRHERFEIKWINHQKTYSLDGASTYQAEEHFSRLRRAEIGIHHHIASAYLQEASWREDNRGISNRDQVNRIAAPVMKRSKNVAFTLRLSSNTAQ
jgi:ISXO2 transposase-like protein